MEIIKRKLLNKWNIIMWKRQQRAKGDLMELQEQAEMKQAMYETWCKEEDQKQASQSKEQGNWDYQKCDCCSEEISLITFFNNGGVCSNCV
jgi:hypothetical protein